MSSRRIALALAAAAAGLYLGVALPAGTRLSAARSELREVQRRRDAGASELAGQRRREEALLRQGRRGGNATLMGVRREIVSALDQASLEKTTVEVRPGRAPAVAVVSVGAEGDFAELMGVTQRLADPSAGLVLDRVQLLRSSRTLTLKVEGRAVGALP